jgi:hypothetical protein
MYQKEYLMTSIVGEFINWMEKRLDTPNSFVHNYVIRRPFREWKCISIYDAFINYDWNFNFRDPINEDKISGSVFDDSYSSLSKLSNGLNRSINDLDFVTCQKYCCSVLEWGGVLNSNDKRIALLGNDICNYLKEVRTRFTSAMSHEEYYTNEIIMNSGFSKIYSLCIDDFIIYDGRVGAALGFLVRTFCEDNCIDKVPEELKFAWGKGRDNKDNNGVNRRDPCRNGYEFPKLSNNPKRHTENNIKANWLLREILDKTKSKFSKLDKDIQMRALESALFMIGYNVSG